MVYPLDGGASMVRGNFMKLMTITMSIIDTRAQTCPPGTQDMLGTGEACEFCSPGRYDGDSDPATICNMCAGGTVSSEGWTFCTDCASGKHAPPGETSGNCIDCPAGSYSADVAASCSTCLQGQHDNDENPATMCIPCHEGSFSPEGSTECHDCAAGKFDHDSTPDTECTWCPEGTFARVAVVATCQQCEPGQYDDDKNTSTPCLYCPPGKTSVLKRLPKLYAPDDEPSQVLISATGPEAASVEWRWYAPTFREDTATVSPSMRVAIPAVSGRKYVSSTLPSDQLPAENVAALLESAGLPPNNRPNTDADGQWSGVGSVQSTECQSCSAGTYAQQFAAIDRSVPARQNWQQQWIFKGGLGWPNGLVLAHAKYPDCLDCMPGSYTPEPGMAECLLCNGGTRSIVRATSCITCPLGTFAPTKNSSECYQCAVGQYGPITRASNCTLCPEGTGHKKVGGTRMKTCCKPGTWADATVGHTNCYECANPGACVGDGECDIGFEGNWCAVCMEDWFQMSGKCMQCPENSWLMAVAAVIAFTILSAFIVNIATTKGGKKAGGSNLMKEVAATPMSILFTRLQVALPVFKLGMSWPQWLIDMMAMFKGLISLDVSAMTAPECFSKGDAATMYLSRSITKLFVFPLLCLNMTLIFWFFQIFKWRPNGVQVQNYATYNSWVAAYSFLFVMLVGSGFEPFACTNVQGEYLLDAQRELRCYDGVWFFIAAIGVGMLIVYALIIPGFLFTKLLRMKVSHFGDNLAREVKNVELIIRAGWIYERYRPSAWYYEFVMIFQRISSIGISNILKSSENVLLGWICYVALTITCLIIQHKTKPYPEIVVDTEQLFNNPKWPRWLRQAMKGTPKYLSWNNMEKLGIYAQLLSLVFGAYYKISADTKSPLALLFGCITMAAYGLFIVANLVAISLRIWALTREGTTFYEENTTTPLHEYAEAALLGKVFDEMSKGLHIDAKDEDNQTPLFIAVRMSHQHIIRAMVNAGADTNLNCGEGRWTCLHAATDLQTIQLLFHGGADPTLQDMWGMTAEDTHRQEAEQPPPLKKGERQTQADRDKYRALRLKMADVIADKAAERTCDWAWKLFCPKRRTKRVTPYGKIMADRPKRPGIIRGSGAKEEIIRYFYRKFGSEVQVKETPKILAQVLVGETEEENWDLFNLYCKKLEHTHGMCPKSVWKERTQQDDDESFVKEIVLDSYGGSGLTGNLCAPAFKAEDYRVQMGAQPKGHKKDMEEHASDGSYTDGSDDDIADGLPGSLQGTSHEERAISQKLKALKEQAERRKKERRAQLAAHRSGKAQDNTVYAVFSPQHTTGESTTTSASQLRSISMLSIGEQAEVWVARETRRNIAQKSVVKPSNSLRSVSIVDRATFRSPSARQANLRSKSSARNHNRAKVFQ